MLFSSWAMWRGFALTFLAISGSLPACGASTPRTDANSAELQAQALRAEQAREHARVLELEARLSDAERRLASQGPSNETNSAAWSNDVTSAGKHGNPASLRSQGDFLAEARVAAPAGARPGACVGVATPPAAPQSERERLQQLLDGLREYAADPRSGLSLERREALRVLLRRERQLDLMNPWGDR